MEDGQITGLGVMKRYASPSGAPPKESGDRDDIYPTNHPENMTYGLLMGQDKSYHFKTQKCKVFIKSLHF